MLFRLQLCQMATKVQRENKYSQLFIFLFIFILFSLAVLVHHLTTSTSIFF
eukprot:m.60534 g.60534  ORF g.60534 m.60534 type:complete len:51 (+) comp7948_c0_seq2:3711-3863(+)